MKLTKSKLKQLIKEEMRSIMQEDSDILNPNVVGDTKEAWAASQRARQAKNMKEWRESIMSALEACIVAVTNLNYKSYVKKAVEKPSAQPTKPPGGMVP